MNLSPPLDPSTLERAFGLYRLSRILFAAGALGIADRLTEGPKSAADLARETNTIESPLKSLLDALTGWGVFSRDEHDCYGLTPYSRRMVTAGEGAANLPFLLGWTGLPAAYDA
jgi:hypothetical protein